MAFVNASDVVFGVFFEAKLSLITIKAEVNPLFIFGLNFVQLFLFWKKIKVQFKSIGLGIKLTRFSRLDLWVVTSVDTENNA